jgi:peptidoglycan/xylan/chitin deacetylase (PgdA/CDA1 family)
VSEPRFSVVIPTHQRRDVVVRMVGALERQSSRNFEVIVVDDGSTDGTAAALRELTTSFPLLVLEQAHDGQAAARNLGARHATGELLLFLDDDMEADPELLSEHDRSHRDGADMVLGHIPLHPSSPSNLLSDGVGGWAERRRERLTRGGEVPIADLLTGQLSVERETFERLGGFDTGFTRDGLFGGEDLDFGQRMKDEGLRVVFNEAAVSRQLWTVDPAAYLARAREAGRSAEELHAKHPELAGADDRARRFNARSSSLVFGTLAAAPASLSRPLHTVAAGRVRRGHRDRFTEKLFLALRTTEYRRGARRARRQLRAPLAVVLAYHSISDLGDDAALADYGVPPDRLAEQLDALRAEGACFISLDTLVGALDGREPCPEGALLLTFDDAYEDLATAAAPILAEREIPAVVFVVADRIGGTNDWDRALSARALRLVDEHGLRRLALAGIEVGSHAATHRRLPELDPAELERELVGSAERIASLGLPRPRSLSYPYGRWTPQVAAAARAAGYSVAFTVEAGTVRRATNRWALPRIEVLAGDSGRTLRRKLSAAGWSSRRRPRVLGLTRLKA